MKLLRPLLAAIAAVCLYAGTALAQGTLPIALQQQFSFSGCSTTSAVCGSPLSGGLLYFYQVGTVATPQQSYQDTGLSILNPWPLVLDSNGRVPPFYLANGSVHVRLTDSNGVAQFDYPNMLVIGPSSGSGGGSSVDPTTIASTGDIKFRPTGETISGWVRLNGLTIGSATSGATGRANADTQNLFTYLWTNCAQPTSNNHCAVVGEIGSSALADFNANKQLTLVDLRGRSLIGLDDMGNTAAGRLYASQVTSGGSDTVTTPNASGGASQATLTQAQLPNYNLPVTDPSHSHGVGSTVTVTYVPEYTPYNVAQLNGSSADQTGTSTTGISVGSGGSGQAHNTVSPFLLGSWYEKL